MIVLQEEVSEWGAPPPCGMWHRPDGFSGDLWKGMMVMERKSSSIYHRRFFDVKLKFRVYDTFFLASSNSLWEEWLFT